MARRFMHFVEGPVDVRAARARIERSPDDAHWVVSLNVDHPGDVPPNAEWICLPGSTDDEPWNDAVARMVTAFAPDTFVVHTTYDRSFPTRRDRLTNAHSNCAIVDGSVTDRKIGYVLKKFPRYSETFILREVLALEALGSPVQVFSLNPPLDGRFHHLLGRLATPVEYLPPVTRGKAVQQSLPKLAPDMRPAFEKLQWELVDRGRPDIFGYLAHAVHIALAARERGIEHLHAHFATSASETARMAAALAGVTYSFTTHAKDMYADTVDIDGYASLLDDAAFAVTVCRANEAYLRDTYPAARDKVHVLYNGIDFTDLDEPATGAPVVARVADDLPLVLAVGRFVEKKGFDLLLDAFADLRRRGVHFRARILGDGELFDDMLERRRSLGLDDVVDMPGSASMQHVREAMREASIVVCPSKVAANGDKDALPTVLLEALSLGVPCIGTDVGGIGEILDGGRAGLLVRPDADDLADAVSQLLKSDDIRRDLGVLGRRHAEAQFDLTKNVGVLKSWFDERAERGHVLVLSQDAGIAWTSTKGASVHLRSIATSARESGFRTSVFVRDQLADRWRGGAPSFREVRPHVSVTAYFKASGERPDVDREFAALARNSATIDAIVDLHETHPVDLIYERYSLWSDAGARAAKALGVPFVVEVNAPLIAEQIRYRSLHHLDQAKRIEHDVLTSADRVVVVSQALRRHVLDLGVSSDRVRVMRNVADPRRFSCPRYAPSHDRSEFRIGFSGAMKPWHGISQFIEVFRHVHAARPNVRLELLGDSRYRAKLEDDIAAFDLSDVVTFHGHVDHTEVPAYMANWDLVVAPYPAIDDFYFSPLKLAEAMAAGRPIMASAIGDIPELLGHGRHGLLIPAGEWTEWETALIDAIDHPDRLVAVAESARRTASSWSWDEHVQVAVGDVLAAGGR